MEHHKIEAATRTKSPFSWKDLVVECATLNVRCLVWSVHVPSWSNAKLAAVLVNYYQSGVLFAPMFTFVGIRKELEHHKIEEETHIKSSFSWKGLVREYTSFARTLAHFGFVVAVGVLSWRGPVQNLLSSKQIMNTSFDSFRLVNTYGAFGHVGKER